MMAWIFMNRQLLFALALAGLAAGVVGYVMHIRAANAALSADLATAEDRVRVAEAGEAKVRDQAAALIAARDEAHAERIDMIERIRVAEDACLDVRIPDALLDQ